MWKFERNAKFKRNLITPDGPAQTLEFAQVQPDFWTEEQIIFNSRDGEKWKLVGSFRGQPMYQREWPQRCTVCSKTCTIYDWCLVAETEPSTSENQT